MILILFSYRNLAHSVHDNVWSLPRAVLEQIQSALQCSDEVSANLKSCRRYLNFSSTKRSCPGYQVFAFITVGPSKHFQGVVRIKQVDASLPDGEDLAISTVPLIEERQGWKGSFGVEWMKICELPYDRLVVESILPSVDDM